MSETLTAPSMADRLHELVRHLDEHVGFRDVVASLTQGHAATLDGVWGSSRALVAAALVARAPGPLVVVCPHLADIDVFAADMALFSAERAARFPAWESEPGLTLPHDEIHADRLRMLKRLCEAVPPKLVITSIQSLLQPVPDREALAARTRQLKVGQTADREELVRWLVEQGFHTTSGVELPGEVALRGGIIDIFAPDWFEPVRVEWFGDEVESLRRFDVTGQRSLGSLEAVDITLISPGERASGEHEMHTPEHLAAYLPSNAWWLLIEPAELDKEGRRYLERLENPQDFHTVRATFQRMVRFPTVTAEHLAAGSLETMGRLQIESVERFSGDINKVRGELDTIGGGQTVVVVCETEAEVARLEEIFSSTQLAGEGRLNFVVGRLSEGFRLTAQRTVLVSGAELFHRSDLFRTSRRRLGRAIDSFLDLREGDLIVHLSHGIGRYRGLTMLAKNGHVEEHLELEFHGGTKIYVPSSKIELVQKYIGGTSSKPVLARIGGMKWMRQKEAAEQAVTDLATDMLEVQAARAARPGIRFPEDTPWQHEFDASFPYQETPDQIAAIQEIKQDMVQMRPMDRLLCGDVGFGKTELAMRAAFKAVEAGYQVAVLVPTTILAEQHRRTFGNRMAEFPVQIATLSRFSTKKEQAQIVECLKRGTIDIVIGTHRLVQGDVQFQNLGLVIIDEEQRFGVEVKERLKSLRTTVDVLTMTATPIPRTLHMSLLGVRGISSLESPPEDRLSVETRVTRWADEMVRHAVLRELNRNGQIYFVHNRVRDIELIAEKLRRVVPEARLEVAHGQMPESQLEHVMMRFLDYRFDLLLATTIVESGLDIPNANTIFIDEADRYGLADLHQLRGRVGRYKHRAYCYLLIGEDVHLSGEAARRLRAIEEFSQLGAGFSLAMRDLELRGAGNLLGTQQSGHIANVGYELYCTLLESAIRSLQKLPPRESIDVHLDLPGEAYLPTHYVSDMRTKIDLYRRLMRIASPEELADFDSELVDRFGPLPPEVDHLIRVARLRILAHRCQIDGIHREGPYVVFSYASRAWIERLVTNSKGRLRVVDDHSAYLPVPDGFETNEACLTAIETLLQAS